jgi:hypothetical protein
MRDGNSCRRVRKYMRSHIVSWTHRESGTQESKQSSEMRGRNPKHPRRLSAYFRKYGDGSGNGKWKWNLSGIKDALRNDKEPGGELKLFLVCSRR